MQPQAYIFHGSANLTYTSDLCLEEIEHIIYYYMSTSVILFAGYTQLLVLFLLVYLKAKKCVKSQSQYSPLSPEERSRAVRVGGSGATDDTDTLPDSGENAAKSPRDLDSWYEEIPSEYLEDKGRHANAYHQIKVYRDEEESQQKDYNKEANDLLKILADPHLYKSAQEPRVDTLMMNIFRISGSIAASGVEEKKRAMSEVAPGRNSEDSKPMASRKSVSASSIGAQCSEQVKKLYTSILGPGEQRRATLAQDLAVHYQRPGSESFAGGQQGGDDSEKELSDDAEAVGKRRRQSVTFYLGEPSSRDALFRKRKQSTAAVRHLSPASATPANDSFLYSSPEPGLARARTEEDRRLSIIHGSNSSLNSDLLPNRPRLHETLLHPFTQPEGIGSALETGKRLQPQPPLPASSTPLAALPKILICPSTPDLPYKEVGHLEP